MRPAFRLLITVVPVVALAACTVPTAPETSQKSCLDGKVPNALCVSRDWVNPLGDWVNPLGDDTLPKPPESH